MTASTPVVLLHGFATSSARTWWENGWLDLLKEAGREPVAIDILGHGNADKPHDPAAYADLEGWVAERLPDGPLDAIGFSLGARLLLGVGLNLRGILRFLQRFRRDARNLISENGRSCQAKPKDDN